jgi:hypothetical protein
MPSRRLLKPPVGSITNLLHACWHPVDRWDQGEGASVKFTTVWIIGAPVTDKASEAPVTPPESVARIATGNSVAAVSMTFYS